VSTQSLSHSENVELLNKQRALRPESPWYIYQPQLTSMSSIANRATGAGLAAGTLSPSRRPRKNLDFADWLSRRPGFYAIFLGHLVLPAFGVPFDSATIISTFAEFPEWAKLSVKAAIAGPASFHTLNGFRHLSWDTGYCALRVSLL
jgi:succinate dehydrogenase (ubiquinone) cytochrome b560 subunit